MWSIIDTLAIDIQRAIHLFPLSYQNELLNDELINNPQDGYAYLQN